MKTQQMEKSILYGLLIGAFFNFTVLAQNSNHTGVASANYTEEAIAEIEAQPNDGYTDAEIAEMINNPLSSLWLFFSQNDTVWYNGDITGKDRVLNTLLLNPVMPMQLTEDIKWIFRPAIPINSFESPSGIKPGVPPSLDWDRETGIGDIVLFNVFATEESAKPPNIFGAGFTTMLDTATDDSLGLGKWSAGPAVLGMHITDKWIYGVIYQHWWSFAGDDDRDDVNLSDLQYILRYRLTSETNIGLAPNIRYNWDADSDNALSLPVGIGADTMVKLGKIPVKIGLETYYYIETPDDFGPEWQVRLIFTPVLPSPGWAKNPLFGK